MEIFWNLFVGYIFQTGILFDKNPAHIYIYAKFIIALGKFIGRLFLI